MIHGLGILSLGADLLDTGRYTPIDVVLQAGAVALAGYYLVARTDAEELVGKRHRLTGQRGRQKRAGVVVAIAGINPAGYLDTRKRFRSGELQVGVVLVVTQQDVEPRCPLLDEMALERQRLDQRVGHDDLERRHLVE